MGYYQASEQIGDLSLAPVGERVAETIKKDFSLAVAFVVRLSFCCALEKPLSGS